LTSTAGKSPTWYSSLVDHLPIAVLRTTIEGQVVYCNRAAVELFGFNTHRSFSSYPITSWYQNKKDRGVYIQNLGERDYLKDFVLGFKKRNGTPFWCSVTSRAIKDGDGTIEYIDAVFRDISAELAPNFSLFQSNEAESPGMNFVVTVDQEGTILTLTHEDGTLLGYSPVELIGSKLPELLTPKCRTIFPQILRQVKQSGKSKGIFTILDKTGGSHHLEFYAIAVAGVHGATVMEIVARDVTEMILMQRAQLERQKFQGVLEMSGAVAHTLNQPMTVISNLLGDLETSLSADPTSTQKLHELKLHLGILGEVLKKIGKIRRYVPMSYVGGIKIVDIEKSSTPHPGFDDDQENPAG
jgi:PAS domain S-box-containing protein